MNVPKYNSMEFEPFKFQIERNDLMYGYTMEELYGYPFYSDLSMDLDTLQQFKKKSLKIL